MRRTLISVFTMFLLVGCGQSSPIDVTDSNTYEVTTAPLSQDSAYHSDSVSAGTDQNILRDETMNTDSASSETPTQATVPTELLPQESEPDDSGESPPTEPALSVTVPPEPPTEETVPTAIEPEQTQPAETEPSEPEFTEPIPAEPAPAQIDTVALEAYGRSYASSTYGYNGTSACNPNTGAGYFPGATKQILTMEDGYRLVQQAIDSQYRRDMAYGYSPFEEINGVTVRCPINIRVEPTCQPYVYVIWVYYGGDA